MTYISSLPNYKFVLVSCKIFGFLNFHVSHLNHETFKLCLQNTLNMSKKTRVYFRVLQTLSRHKANQALSRPRPSGLPTGHVATQTAMSRHYAFCHSCMLATRTQAVSCVRPRDPVETRTSCRNREPEFSVALATEDQNSLSRQRTINGQ